MLPTAQAASLMGNSTEVMDGQVVEEDEGAATEEEEGRDAIVGKVADGDLCMVSVEKQVGGFK